MNKKPEALRYDVGDEYLPGMYYNPEGDWVRYADYENLHAENKRLRELLNRLEYSSDGHIKRYPEEEEVNAALCGDKT